MSIKKEGGNGRDVSSLSNLQTETKEIWLAWRKEMKDEKAALTAHAPNLGPPKINLT